VEIPHVLDARRDPYLADHALGGHPVLPMAMGCELIAEAAALAVPDLELVALRDLTVLHGIVLDKGPRAVRIAATPSTAAGDRVLVDVTIIGAEDPRRIHYRAVAEMAARTPAPPAEWVPALSDVEPFPLTVTDAYRWLFHGPRFQGVTAISGITSAGISGTLAPSRPRDLLGGGPEAPWLIDPVVVDSALQLILFWLRVHWGVAALPSRFAAYRRFGDLPAAGVECRARIWGDPADHVLHADVALLDTAGRVVAILEDVEGTCSKALIPMFEDRADAQAR
jgi:hypothetical protein